MRDKNDPGRKPKGNYQLKDNDIVELTDEMTSEVNNDEEIIDLSDIKDIPLEENEKEDIIDFENETGENEEIINLVEVEDPMPENEADEAVIEIIDIEDKSKTGLPSASEKKAEIKICEDLQKGRESVSISSEQIEKALERVIKRMYSESIQNRILEVIEKAVSKEIKRLKKIILDDADMN